ncbi:hypothetical protein ABZS66_43160 [Dactylosporangium sp. NPDC005572]|uniref:hypothetical protein n=1 Tax=Dactylosporangium sp. NPDC005572 TaxID=3156889 RepID=UPI0033ADD93C
MAFKRHTPRRHDVAVQDTGMDRASAGVPERRAGWFGVAVAWMCVGLVELFNVPNVAVSALLVTPVELVLWLVAGWLTLRPRLWARPGPLLRTAVASKSTCSEHVPTSPAGSTSGTAGGTYGPATDFGTSGAPTGSTPGAVRMWRSG